MPDWIKQLNILRSKAAAVTSITVIDTHGSVPRKTGARMLVALDSQQGTIGGGNLEFSAIRVARDRLLASDFGPQRQKFALGPALGQCCGGAVELLFETIDSDIVITDTNAGWYCRRIDEAVIDSKNSLFTAELPKKIRAELDLISPDTRFTIVEHDGQTWACDKLTSDRPVVFLFGAGHVGQAVIAQLSLLACDIVWIDERTDIFPAVLADRVTQVQSDCPANEVINAPCDAWFVVMTHSHATDFDICRAVLEKKQLSFLGLIGSQTKRSTFRKRLAHRGIDQASIDRLCCPVGIEGIRSNLPEAIAVGIAAQLMMLWESEITYKRSGDSRDRD